MRHDLLAAALVALALASPARGAEVVATVRDKRGRPVADAVVYLDDPAAPAPGVPAEPYVMDQVDREFVPRVLPVLRGGLVRFPNRDAIHHEVYSFSPAKTFELPLYKGQEAPPLVFETTGAVKVGCNIHDWMSAVILVLPTPCFATTGKDGRATLRLPPAERADLVVYHERLAAPVASTRRTVRWRGGGPARPEWRLSLKVERPRTRRAVTYR